MQLATHQNEQAPLKEKDAIFEELVCHQMKVFDSLEQRMELSSQYMAKLRQKLGQTFVADTHLQSKVRQDRDRIIKLHEAIKSKIFKKRLAEELVPSTKQEALLIAILGLSGDEKNLKQAKMLEKSALDRLILIGA